MGEWQDNMKPQLGAGNMTHVYQTERTKRYRGGRVVQEGGGRGGSPAPAILSELSKQGVVSEVRGPRHAHLQQSQQLPNPCTPTRPLATEGGSIFSGARSAATRQG
jgi:hypothetical protein